MEKIRFDGREFDTVNCERAGQLIQLDSRNFARIIGFNATDHYWLAEKTRRPSFPNDEPHYVVMTENFAASRRVVKD